MPTTIRGNVRAGNNRIIYVAMQRVVNTIEEVFSVWFAYIRCWEKNVFSTSQPRDYVSGTEPIKNQNWEWRERERERKREKKENENVNENENTFKQRWQRRRYCLATASKQQLLGKANKQRFLGNAYNSTDSDMFSICQTLGYISSYS
jgi:hypothetical protein